MIPNSQSNPSTMPQPGQPATATPHDWQHRYRQQPEAYGRFGYYGAPAARGPVVVPPSSLWSRVPVAYWVALGIGALAFVVHISYQQTTSDASGYSCTYSDFAGFLAAGALVVLTIAGWLSRAGRQLADRLPMPLMVALTVLFLALAFVHALRGNGTIMSPCDAQPMP